MKTKCQFCQSKTEEKHYFRNLLMCHECVCEYMGIFDGWTSNKKKKRAAYLKKNNLIDPVQKLLDQKSFQAINSAS